MLRRTSRCLGLAAAAAAVCVTGALAGGLPGPGVRQGGAGVTGPNGVRYVAVGAGDSTTVKALRARSGRLLRFGTFAGGWGIPLVSFDQRAEGVSRDGLHLVLGDTPNPQVRRTQSRFLVLATRTLRNERRIVLRGNFSYDAASPDFRTLFLVERMVNDPMHYVVRALDVRSGRLRPDVVKDRRSHEWLMQGIPLTRATSRNGAWAYTLYGGGPHAFVHALDTRHGKAVCIDLPWRGLPDSLWRLRARLDGSRLVLRRPDGLAAAVVGTGALRILSVRRAP